MSTSGDYSTRQSRNEVFCCKVCIETFPSKLTLARHERSHRATARRERSEKQIASKHYSMRQSENKSFECNICIETFPSKLTLVRHERSHCGEGSLSSQHHSPVLENCPQPSLIPRKSKDSNNALESSNQGDDSTKESYGYSHSGKHFKDEQVKRHEENEMERSDPEVDWFLPWHHSVNLQNNSETSYTPGNSDDPNNASESESSSQSDDSIEKCSSHSDSGESSEDEQLKMHHDKSKTRFKSKTFSVKASQKSHKEVRSGQKHFFCELCCRSFAWFTNLKAHRRIHTGEKPFACSLCDKSFSDPNTMKRHRRVHTKEKPYECDVCMRAFARRDNLAAHMTTHISKTRTSKTHASKESFRFICEVCDERFRFSTHLAKHLLIHAEE